MKRLLATVTTLSVLMLLSVSMETASAEERGYFLQHGYANLGIPEGHLPPPGECRVWYPGRPAGHQPPPGKCERLSLRVPVGAWLIYRPKDDPKHVRISVYDVRRPSIVVIIGIFDAFTGVFVREFRPR
jgi:hypothetical protein